LSRVGAKASQTELRNLLGCFLFSEDDVFKRIGVLSGGERNRYALARLLLRPSNFLLLDEPTNHLDMRAKDVLLESIAGFSGTVVFVSHDRYFIDKLATRVFEIGGGEVRIFPGDYEDYLWRKEGAHLDLSLSANGGQPREEPAAAAPSPAVKPEKRVNPMKLKKMDSRRQELENGISKIEQEIAASEESLGHFVSVEETLRLTREVEEKRAELARLMHDWEEVSQKLETMMA
jgi:ATP-binding cassette subfamily F protein 3